jgi:integrase
VHETPPQEREIAWDAAKLERIFLHSCRHTFASLMIDANVNLKTIQTCMGHGSIGVTLDVYGHMLPTGLHDLRVKADAYLADASG